MNKAIIFGYITKDPELKTLPSGIPVCSFTVATNRVWKDKDGNKYLAHTLNNTVVAPPRMLIAFLENNLNEDGSISIPKVLQPYMGKTEKLIPKHA